MPHRFASCKWPENYKHPLLYFYCCCTYQNEHICVVFFPPLFEAVFCAGHTRDKNLCIYTKWNGTLMINISIWLLQSHLQIGRQSSVTLPANGWQPNTIIYGLGGITFSLSLESLMLFECFTVDNHKQHTVAEYHASEHSIWAGFTSL